jgi:hypothetical protein
MVCHLACVLACLLIVSGGEPDSEANFSTESQ